MRKLQIYALSVGMWFVLLVIAVLNGAIREAVLVPNLDEPVSHVIGTLFATAMMATVMFFFIRWIVPSCRTLDFWLIGFLWLAMTVSFEFLFFHFVMGKPWEELLADYNVFRGRVWVLVLIVTLFGPVVFGSLSRRDVE